MKKNSASNKDHQFGGPWTEIKLRVLKEYMAAYTTALKKQSFHKLFIDAFAGTGYRTTREIRSGDGNEQGLLFPDLADDEPQKLLEGSARLALKTDPPFDEFIFIELDPERCKQLEDLKTEFPNKSGQIQVQCGDANVVLQNLCEQLDWTHRRAVVFLDPYGMQVDWTTLVAIARTKAIDLWILFPLGIGTNRLLTRSGQIPEGWKNAISRLLGHENWYREFYDIEESPDLFGHIASSVKKKPIDVIGKHFNNRLKTIFEGVAEPPGVLYNSALNPLYLLCFAAGNRNGAPIAVRIAKNLLKKVGENT